MDVILPTHATALHEDGVTERLLIDPTTRSACFIAKSMHYVLVLHRRRVLRDLRHAEGHRLDVDGQLYLVCRCFVQRKHAHLTRV